VSILLVQLKFIILETDGREFKEDQPLTVPLLSAF